MRHVFRDRTRMAGLAAAAICLAAVSGLAPPPARAEPGPVTGRDLPRYVSLKTRLANARRGPGLNYRVDWVFQRRGMPLQVTAEYDNWRRVRDKDGVGGWIHYSLLSLHRTAVVVSERAALRRAPKPDAPLAAWLEQGVIASIESCAAKWCALEADGHAGWALKTEFWGADAGETFE